MSTATTKPATRGPEIARSPRPKPPAAPANPLDKYLDLRAAESEDAAFAAHHRHLNRIAAHRADYQTVLVKTLAANGHPGTVTLRHSAVADARTAETADRDLPELAAALAADIAAREAALRSDLDATLDQMVRDRRVGVIDWGRKPGVCTFTFHLCRTEVETGAWKTLVGGREREMVQRHHHTRHKHHLIGAKAHPLPAPEVARPARVQALLDAIPPGVRGEVRVVDGTLISKSVDPWDEEGARWVETESIPVQTRDPAVVLGDYVLTGWTVEEVEEEQRQRRLAEAKREEERRLAEAQRERERRRAAVWSEDEDDDRPVKKAARKRAGSRDSGWAQSYSVGEVVLGTLGVLLALAVVGGLIWGVVWLVNLVVANWDAILHVLKIIGAVIVTLASFVTLGLLLWNDPEFRQWLNLD